MNISKNALSSLRLMFHCVLEREKKALIFSSTYPQLRHNLHKRLYLKIN